MHSEESETSKYNVADVESENIQTHSSKYKNGGTQRLRMGYMRT